MRRFFKSFFYKLAHSIVVHTFFDLTGNPVDETAATFEPMQFMYIENVS